MKKILFATTIALAAAATAVTPAQAKGKGFGIGLGVGLLVGGAILHHHHHRPRTVVVPSRPVVVQPTQVQPVAAPIVRAEDGAGRIYDVASRTWFDGRDRCWTGTQAWTFKGGSWFYGSATWYESAGQWVTNAAAPPTQVDCATNPVFAAKMPGRERTASPVTPASTAPAGEEPKVNPDALDRMRAALAEGNPASNVQ